MSAMLCPDGEARDVRLRRGAGQDGVDEGIRGVA